MCNILVTRKPTTEEALSAATDASTTLLSPMTQASTMVSSTTLRVASSTPASTTRNTISAESMSSTKKTSATTTTTTTIAPGKIWLSFNQLSLMQLILISKELEQVDKMFNPSKVIQFREDIKNYKDDIREELNNL